VFFPENFSCDSDEKNILFQILESHPLLFKNILKNADKHRVQILYTQIDRDSTNHPHFKSYSYRLNTDRYFYPASTVKLPAAEFLLTAVIQVNENQIYNDDKYEYDEIAFPFLANLGRVIYDYEVKRPRQFQSSLVRFKVYK